jgi:hypothetical protein
MKKKLSQEGINLQPDEKCELYGKIEATKRRPFSKSGAFLTNTLDSGNFGHFILV